MAKFYILTGAAKKCYREVAKFFNAILKSDGKTNLKDIMVTGNDNGTSLGSNGRSF